MHHRISTVIVLSALWFLPLTGHSEEVVRATVCQVISDPVSFNHKLIKVTGVAFQGMEKFSLAVYCSVDKKNFTGIWLEYGGKNKPARNTAAACPWIEPERQISPLTVFPLRWLTMTSFVHLTRWFTPMAVQP